MGLESAAFIAELNPTNPVGSSDPKSQGDDHLRLIKTALQGTFPNFVGTAGVPKSITFSEDELNDAVRKAVDNVLLGRLETDDSTTVRAGLNIPDGVAPTAPVQGDIWATADGVFMRNDGVNKSIVGGGITRIHGQTGIPGADTTWHNLQNDLLVSDSTFADVMTDEEVGPGTWKFKYTIIYQGSTTAAGIGFAINHTGTVDSFRARWMHVTTGAAGTTGQGDSNTAIGNGQMMEGKAGFTLNAVIGTDTLAVAHADEDVLATLEGIIVVTGVGDLVLKARTDFSDDDISIMADTTLELLKIE